METERRRGNHPSDRHDASTERCLRADGLEPSGIPRSRARLATVGTLSLVPLVLLAALSFGVGSSAVRRRVDSELQAVAQLSAGSVQARMESLGQLVASYASRRLLRAAVAGQVTPEIGSVSSHLEGLRQAQQGLDIAFVVDASGRLLELSPSDPALVGRDFSFRDWYQGVTSSGRPYFSEAYESSAPGKPRVVAVAAPLLPLGRDTGHPLGYLVVGYTLTALQQFVDEYAVSHGVAITVTDKNAVLLAGEGAPVGGMASLRHRPHVEAALVGHDGVGDAMSQDQRQRVAFRSIDGLRWAISASIPHDRAFAPVRQLRAIVLAGAAVLAVMLVGGLVFFARAERRRSRAESAAAASQRLVQDIIDNSAAVIYVKDTQGRYLLINRRFEEVVGFTRSQVVRRTDDELQPPEIAGPVQANDRRVLEQRSTLELEEMVPRDGEARTYLSLKFPLFSPDGTPYAVAGISTDITDRKVAEEQLRVREQQLANAQRLAGVGSWTLHVSTEEATWSEELYRIYGFDPDDRPTDADVLARVHRDDRPRLEEERARAILARGHFEVETRFQRPDGRLRYLLHHAEALSSAESADVMLVGTVQDLTDRKRDAETLERRASELARVNAQLARSNDELAQFAYVASHDLAEPLRAVSGFVQLIPRRHEGALDEQADRYITHTVEGAARMRTLIDDLLAMSGLGNAASEPVRVDVGCLVTDVCEALAVPISESQAEVTWGPMPLVWGDPAPLAQLFQNLIANAIKFRRPGETPKVVITAERDGSLWRFWVADNGIGIEPKYRERIFRMFQRLHSRVDYEGTGIGLALVKKIVERHDGDIWVEDTEGGGATFCFTLPITVGPEPTDAHLEQEAVA